VEAKAFEMAASNSTTRFSNRVDDYVKYRPHYPTAIIDYLKTQYQLTGKESIADVGAGTGISSALFLNAGYPVTAIEPNPEMREKSIDLLKHYPHFKALDGTAEHTGLAAESMDILVAGQAFHWFDAASTKPEFKRILKPTGIVVLVWNERKIESPFEQEYDRLILKHARDYVQVHHRNIEPSDLAAFFSPEKMHTAAFENHQVFDFDGLKGRLASSSYMPASRESGYDEMVQELQLLFDRYAQAGNIRIQYVTKVYSGRLNSSIQS